MINISITFMSLSVKFIVLPFFVKYANFNVFDKKYNLSKLIDISVTCIPGFSVI